jgi:hypothetical protein
MTAKVGSSVSAIIVSHTVAGEDWDELERKAAKCKRLPFISPSVFLTPLLPKADLKRADGGAKKRDDSDDSDSDRPKKKKSPAKAKTNGKPNGKTKGKR